MAAFEEYNIFDEINFVTLVNKIVEFSKNNKDSYVNVIGKECGVFIRRDNLSNETLQLHF